MQGGKPRSPQRNVHLRSCGERWDTWTLVLCCLTALYGHVNGLDGLCQLIIRKQNRCKIVQKSKECCEERKLVVLRRHGVFDQGMNNGENRVLQHFDVLGFVLEILGPSMKGSEIGWETVVVAT